MKLRDAILAACASTLIFAAGEAMANAKDDCIAAGGTWAAVGGDQTSWTCYRLVHQIIKRDGTDSETIFDRWGNALTDIPSAPVNTTRSNKKGLY